MPGFRSNDKDSPDFRLYCGIFLVVCFFVGMFNWLTAPRNQVRLEKAEAATAAPWVSTESATAIPTETPSPAADDAAAPTEGAVTGTWVLNTSSKRFHLPDCSSVPTIKESHRSEFTGPRDTLIEQGYKPCGACKP